MDANENPKKVQNRQVRIYFSYEGRRRLDIGAMVKIGDRFEWIYFDHPKLSDPEDESNWLIRHIDGIPKPWEKDEGQLDWLEMRLNPKLESTWICCWDHALVSRGQDSSFRNQNIVMLMENIDGEILEETSFSPEKGNFGIIARIKLNYEDKDIHIHQMDVGIVFPSLLEFNTQIIAGKPEEVRGIFK